METKDVENPLNDEPLTDNADGDDVPSSNQLDAVCRDYTGIT